jgi:Putative  PD-(D/E)XK family member, (DUF4420)
MEVLARSDVSAFLAVDSTDTIHFLLTPPADRPESFARYRLRALEITNADWIVADRKPQPYLDVRCIGGARVAMRRPFLAFCDDILVELRRVRCTPEQAVLRTCARWQRFWTDEDDHVFSVEWLHGLAAELAWLRELLLLHGPTTVRAWRGPHGADHDFQADTALAAEVKASTVMPFHVHCNLNQLDPGIFTDLLLVCYLITTDPDGDTLPGAVAGIEELLRDEPEALDHFWDSLARAGYRRQAEEQYRTYPYRLARPSVYVVNEAFPKLTVRSFAQSPDARISAVRYVLEVTGVDTLADDQLHPLIARFAR